MELLSKLLGATGMVMREETLKKTFMIIMGVLSIK